MNQRKAEIFDECLTDSFVNHDMPATAPGPAGFRESFAMFQNAFPDMQVHLEEILATDEDKVVTRGQFTGTHKGEFMGVPPSGVTIQVQFIDIWRIEDGRVAENWVRLDLLGLMQQIGAIPA